MKKQNSSFFRGYTKNLDLEKILVDLNLNWRVASVPVTSSSNAGTWANIDFEENIGIIREDTRHPLSVMGDQYVIIQNSEALKVLEPLIEERNVTIEEGGFFKFGKRAWVSARHQKIEIKGFEILGNIMLVWSHNGEVALSAMFIPKLTIPKRNIPVIMASFIPGNPDIYGHYSIKHTKMAKKKMQLAYASAKEFFKSFKSFYTTLVKTSFTTRDMKQLLEFLYPNPKKIREKKDGTPIKSYNEKKRDEIMKRWHEFSKDFQFTKFFSAMAFNYYYDYDSRIRITRGTVEEEQRLMSTWFGTGHKEKIRFLKTLYNFENLVKEDEIK